jgi:protein-export membrane protein SecD
MKKSIVKLVAVLAVIALLAWTALNGLDLGFYEFQSVEDGISLGLDLVGGSEITYEAVIPDGTTDEEISDGMDSAVAMLRQRLDTLGYSEANVLTSSSNRIVVEIPNVEDPEEAVQMLGTTAIIEFRDCDGNVLLTGSDLASAKYQYSAIDETGISQPHVVLTFTEEGREKFKEATKEAANRDDGDNYIAIVMDDEVVSSPTVDSTKYASTGIDSDSAIISMGSGDTEDAIYLASIIAAGQMPFNLECVKLEAVGASLGEKSLETSLLAGAIGILLVMLFMIIMYRVPGLISCIALALYVALFCVVMSVAQLNLSLPGIAGIILTIGMAVDANVVIYERLKEELKSGKTLRSSIDAGYKRAVTAIVDSNITTIIAAAVLWWQGTGTILGFAKTLLIGVVLSMIVMLFVTKFLLKTFVGLKITNVKAYGA